MSIATLLIAIGAHATAATSATPDHQTFLELSSPAIAAEGAMMSRHAVSVIDHAAADERPDQAITAQPAAPSSLDLAIYVGNRRSGPQLEMGALGGGRADAPSLLHVGFGFDF